MKTITKRREVIFNFFKGKRKTLVTFYVTKWWGRILMAGMGIYTIAKGTDKLDKNQRYVLVSNHLSMVDIPVCMSSCPVPFSFLAKKEVDKMLKQIKGFFDYEQK